MSDCQKMKRRTFLKKGLALGVTAGGALLSWDGSEATASDDGPGVPDLVAVKNAEPDPLLEAALSALGGIAQFVKPGQTVLVKPNIGWNRSPETGANTNPALVAGIVRRCVLAGAKKVYVFDNSCGPGDKCYRNSGIHGAARSAGAVMVPCYRKDFVEVRIPGAKILKKTAVHRLVMDSDVFINVPVLKHHMSTHLTVAMKNLMGVVWDRGWYHGNGLDQCIADFCRLRKPNLNIVDAYRVTMANGPQYARKEDIALKRTLLAARDIVTADAAAARIFGTDPERIEYIRLAHLQQIGNMDLSELKIRKITL